MEPTKEQLNAGLRTILAVTEAIREAKRIPSGTLYALLCGKMDKQAYDKMVETLKRTGLVREEFHELIWSGPEIA